MKKFYESNITVLDYIIEMCQSSSNKKIDSRTYIYLTDLGLDCMILNKFVDKFNLRNKSFDELLDFVLSTKSKNVILSYYQQTLWEKVPKREESAYDSYDYGQGTFHRKF